MKLLAPISYNFLLQIKLQNNSKDTRVYINGNTAISVKEDKNGCMIFATALTDREFYKEKFFRIFRDLKYDKQKEFFNCMTFNPMKCKDVQNKYARLIAIQERTYKQLIT